MLVQDNVQQAQDTYAAFMRGDIAAVMEAMADDVEWVIPGPSDLPFTGTRRGKQAVQEWFGILGQNVAFQVFEPREYVAQRDMVVVLVHTEATALPTGRTYVNPEVHVLTYQDGKLARFQTYEDTAAIVAAFKQ